MKNPNEATLVFGEEFEKRLAELVWENSPELARSTAAGNLALSIDTKAAGVRRLLLDALTAEVVASLKAEVINELRKELSGSHLKTLVQELVDDSKDQLRESIKDRSARKIDAVVAGRVLRAVEEYCGGKDESFALIIRSRIDALIDSHLTNRLNSNKTAMSAINEGEMALAYSVQENSEVEPDGRED